MVSLYVDGQKRVLGTSADTVSSLLDRAGVTLRRGDLVEPAPKTVMTDGMFNVNVYRARPVTVVDGYRSYRLASASQSPHRLAEQAGLTVYPEDTYVMDAVTDIVPSEAVGDRITVQRSVPYTVKVDGKVRALRTQGKTVGAALKTSGIALGLNDSVTVPATTPILPGLSFGVVRVSEVVTDISEVLPRPTKTTNDSSLLKGQTQTTTEGADGAKVTTYKIHYKDGVETGREVIKLLSRTEPQPKVMVVGTKVLFSGSVEYWRPMVAAAAAQWNFDPNVMMRIMACESRGNATVVSQFIVNGEHPMGLFQYLPTTWKAAGGTDANILDGPTQIQITAKKMALYGTGPWQCK